MAKKLTLAASFSLFLLAAVFILQAKTQALDPNAKVVFEKDDYIWSISVVTKEKTKIAKGNFPALSEKIGAPSPSLGQNEVAYILTEENSHFDAKTDKPGIYIYNFLSDETKYINYPVSDTTLQLTWSPNGKYLLVGTHISTYDTKTLITRKGKIKMSFITPNGNQFRWFGKNKIIYTSFHDVDPLRPRGEGGGMGFGISKITYKGKNKILKKPNALTDYIFFGMVDGNKIGFIKWRVALADDWSNSAKIKTSYWEMNLNGKNIKKAKKLVSWEQKIKKALPEKYENYQVIDYGSPSYEIDYRLFVMNKGYDVEDEEIYIMKVSKPNTLKKLSDGYTPSWGWNLN
jgi:hypothetical protein